MPTPNTSEQTHETVGDVKKMEYQEIRAELQKYGENSKLYSNEFLSFYERNYKANYDQFKTLLQKDQCDPKTQTLIESVNTLLDTFNLKKQAGNAEKRGQYQAALERYVGEVDHWGPIGTTTKSEILSDGRGQITVFSSLSGLILTITSTTPFVSQNRTNSWEIAGLNANYKNILQASDDVFTLQTMLYRAKTIYKAKDSTPFHLSYNDTGGVLTFHQSDGTVEYHPIDFGEVEASDPKVFRDFANQKYQEMLGGEPASARASSEKAEVLAPAIEMLDAAMSAVFELAMDHLNALEAGPQKTSRDILDAYYSAFQVAKRAGDVAHMQTALNDFRREDAKMQSSLQEEKPSPRISSEKAAVTPKKAPDGQALSGSEQVTETADRTAWLQRLNENFGRYVQQSTNDQGSPWVEVNLPTPEDLRHSRIQDIIGPEGKAVIGLKTETLANTVLTVPSPKGNLEYRWKEGTWKNSRNERLRVLNGTSFMYKNAPLAIPSTKEGQPVGNSEVAATKAVSNLEKAQIEAGKEDRVIQVGLDQNTLDPKIFLNALKDEEA